MNYNTIDRFRNKICKLCKCDDVYVIMIHSIIFLVATSKLFKNISVNFLKPFTKKLLNVANIQCNVCHTRFYSNIRCILVHDVHNYCSMYILVVLSKLFAKNIENMTVSLGPNRIFSVPGTNKFYCLPFCLPINL